jgi:hypothetical protein
VPNPTTKKHIYRINSHVGVAGTGVTQASIIELWAYAKNHPQYPYTIANEMISAELGSTIRLGVPPHGLFRDSIPPNNTYFASIDYNLDRSKLPPADIDKTVTDIPFDASGLLLFDVLIANPDRHPGNLAVDFSATPPRMHVFDHSHALFGHEPHNGVARLTTLDGRLGMSGQSGTGQHRHCLLDKITNPEHFHEWMSRIEAIPDFFIREVCHEQVGHGINEAEARKAEQFLISRKASIRSLISSHKAEFTGIQDWGLLP